MSSVPDDGVDDEQADSGASVVAGSAAPSAGSWQERIWLRRQAGPFAAGMMELIEWLVVSDGLGSDHPTQPLPRCRAPWLINGR